MTRYAARRLPRQTGPAAWNALLTQKISFGRLDTDITVDFAIIGAGFAGLSAARRLIQLHPNTTVAVLEAGMIAEGAAGRNSGFMIDLPHDLTSLDYAGTGDGRAQIALNRQAIAFARDAVTEYAITPDFYDAAGKVNGAVSPAAEAHNRRYAAHLNTLGEPHEVLDAQAMQALTGSAYYASGLYTPGTVMLQPAGYIHGLCQGLSPHVQIYERSPVISLKRVGGVWRLQAPFGQVTAQTVIMATNGHLESFGFSRGRLMHVFLYASMTPELPSGLQGAPRWGVTPSDPMGTTLRRIDAGQGGNRIITRSCATIRSDMMARDKDVARAARTQRAKLKSRFPDLAGLTPEYEWAGHLCLSQNGVSVTGEIDDSLFSACVQNGLGTARGTLTGIAAAEMACNVTSDISAHFSQEPPPNKLPPQPIRDIGGNAVIRWKESRARLE